MTLLKKFTNSGSIPADEFKTRLVPLDELKFHYVRWVLVLARGNKALAARMLGIDRRSLYRHLNSTVESPDLRAPRVESDGRKNSFAGMDVIQAGDEGA